MANKVKYSIDNAHYAPITTTQEGATNYGTVTALPGAVSVSFEQQGELTPFYADGIKYWTSASNGGYEGDLTIALIPDSFRKDVLGETIDTNKVLIENANVTTKPFALGFSIQGNEKPYYFWFLNCTATRPSIEANTKEDTIEPDTDVLTISCAPSDIVATSGIVRVRTTDDTQSTITDDWFTNVYTPATV